MDTIILSIAMILILKFFMRNTTCNISLHSYTHTIVFLSKKDISYCKKYII